MERGMQGHAYGAAKPESNRRLVTGSSSRRAVLERHAERPETANSGTLNCLEGQASIGTQAPDSKSVGSPQLQAGQSLTREAGKAEVLLTPGVNLRMRNQSSVEMISPGLTNTEVRLEKGRAKVEVV
jgi:hypothetical protein